MFQEPLSMTTVSVAAGPLLSTVTSHTSDDFDLIPASLDQLDSLRRQYGSLLIQLDRLRPLFSSADVQYRPSDQDWSIKEMLGHLIDFDRDIWWPRISALLDSENPYFTDVDQNELVVRHHWQALPLEDILAQLMRVRWDYAMKLNAIADAKFERSGAHPVLGKMPLLRILQLLVAHDAHYIEKIRGLVEETRGRPRQYGL
jgi:hypothetical protein